MLLWIRNDPVSSSGLRKGFLGHVFNRKFVSFMCMYKYCMHVFQPMQHSYVQEWSECWFLLKEKGWDLVSKQDNAMHLESWFFREFLQNFRPEARHRSKHHFIHTPQPFHGPQLPGSSPNPCWVMWRCMPKCCLLKVSSKPRHYLTASKKMAPQTRFVTFHSPHFHSSARLMSQDRILSSMCFQTILFLKLPLTPTWWNTCWRWCDEEWGMYM